MVCTHQPHLEPITLSHIRTPRVDVTPSLCIDNTPNKMQEITTIIENPKPCSYTKQVKNRCRKMKLKTNALEECNYAHVPTVQPSTINHQHLPSLQDGRS